MRQLVPHPIGDVDPAALVAAEERPPPAGRPWLVVNMIASADGAIEVGGRSGPLSGPADRAVFAALRAVADVILVGAGTVRAEDYRPARQRPDGQPGAPIVVVTRSGDLDPAARVFSGGAPVILTCAACPPERRAALEAVADVIVAGDRNVDFAAAMALLGDRGARVVLCEGGPTLNGHLVGAGLVDEWCVTMAPLLAGGAARRAAVGPPPPAPAAMRLTRLLEDDGLLLARYVRT